MALYNKPAEFVDLDVHVHVVTQRAIRVSLDGEDDNAVWLPRSMCKIDSEPERNTDVSIGVQDWIAEREGLV